MPTYRVTAPDGQVFDVTPPEGTNPTQEEILARVRESYYSTSSENTQISEPIGPDLSKEPVLKAGNETTPFNPEFWKGTGSSVGYDPLRLGRLQDWASRTGGYLAGVASDFYDKYLSIMSPDEIAEKDYRDERVGFGEVIGGALADPTTYVGSGALLRRGLGAAPDVAAQVGKNASRQTPRALPGKSPNQLALPPGPVTSAPDAPLGRHGGTTPGRPQRMFVAGDQTAYETVRMEGVPPPRVVDRPEDVSALLDLSIARRSPLTQVESNSLTTDAALRRPLDLGSSGVVRRLERIDPVEHPVSLPREGAIQDYDVRSLGDDIQANKPPGSNDLLPRENNVAREVDIRTGGGPPEGRFVPRSEPPKVDPLYAKEKVGTPRKPPGRGKPAASGTAPEPVTPTFRSRLAEAESHVDIPRTFGATPMEIAKTSGDGATLNVVKSVMDSKELGRKLEAELLTAVESIYRGLNKADEVAVGKFLDGKASLSSLTPAQEKAATALRNFFNKSADAVGIEPLDRVTDYFPRLREVLGVEGRKIVAIPEGEVPVYMQQVIPKKIYQEFFEKPRSLDAPANNLTAAPVIGYARALARRLANGGGKHPLTGEQIPGLINTISDDLAKIPENLVPYFSRYINDNLGFQAGRGEQALSPRAVGRMHQIGYLRTMAYNPVTWMQNAGQNLHTLAVSRPDDFVASTRAALPGSWTQDFLRKHGTLDPMPKNVHKFVRQHEPNFIDRTIGNLTDRGGQPFTKVEDANRAIAAGTAIREAKREAGYTGKALTDADLIGAARDKLRETQFVYGPENTPQSFRKPYSENPVAAWVGASAQQFKPYFNNYVLFAKDIIAADVKDLATGKFAKDMALYASRGDVVGAINSMPMMRLAKYITAGIGAFGTDAFFAGGDKKLSEMLTGKRDTLTFKGLLPSLGIAMGNAVGLGNMPIEDFRSLAFMLPGPMMSMFLDIASASASLATGKNWDLSVDALTTGRGGINNEVINIDQQADKIFRSIPVAGIGVNRLRHGLMQAMTEGPDVRQPLNWAQAMGIEGMGAGNPIKRRGQGNEVLRQSLGFQSPEQREIQGARREVSETKLETQQVQQQIVKLLIAGKTEEANALMKQYPLAIPSTSAFKSGAMKTALPPEVIQFLELQRTLKGRGAEIFGDTIRREE